MKRFARYVDIGGKHNCIELAMIARRHGMKIIRGYKSDMHVYNELALAGTAGQMKKVDAHWRAAGHEVLSRKPSAACGIKTDIPESQWDERSIAMRLAHGCYGTGCEECTKKLQSA